MTGSKMTLLCARRSVWIMYGNERGKRERGQRVVCSYANAKVSRVRPVPKRVYVMVGGLKVGACVWNKRLTASYSRPRPWCFDHFSHDSNERGSTTKGAVS